MQSIYVIWHLLRNLTPPKQPQSLLRMFMKFVSLDPYSIGNDSQIFHCFIQMKASVIPEDGYLFIIYNGIYILVIWLFTRTIIY